MYYGKQEMNLFPWYIQFFGSIKRFFKKILLAIGLVLMFVLEFFLSAFNPRTRLFWIVWIGVACFVGFHFLSKYW